MNVIKETHCAAESFFVARLCFFVCVGGVGCSRWALGRVCMCVFEAESHASDCWSCLPLFAVTCCHSGHLPLPFTVLYGNAFRQLAHSVLQYEKHVFSYVAQCECIIHAFKVTCLKWNGIVFKKHRQRPQTQAEATRTRFSGPWWGQDELRFTGKTTCKNCKKNKIIIIQFSKGRICSNTRYCVNLERYINVGCAKLFTVSMKPIVVNQCIASRLCYFIYPTMLCILGRPVYVSECVMNSRFREVNTFWNEREQLRVIKGS